MWVRVSTCPCGGSGGLRCPQPMFGRMSNKFLSDLANPSGVATALGLGTFDPFVYGSTLDPTTLNSMRLTNIFGSESEVRTLSAVLGDAPEPQDAGRIHSALGFEFRDQTLTTAITATPGLTLKRNVSAAFFEAVLPFVEKSESRLGMESLDVSVAGRLEYYTIFGRVAVPRIAFTWIPWSGLKILGTWGRDSRAKFRGLIRTQQCFVSPGT